MISVANVEGIHLGRASVVEEAKAALANMPPESKFRSLRPMLSVSPTTNYPFVLLGLGVGKYRF